MSSYLENLVNRINQQGAIARPRPVALFEPATPGDFSTWTDVDQPARISTDFQQTPEPGSFPTLKLRPGNTNPVEIRFESPRPAKTIQPPIAPLTDQPAKPVIAPISEAAALHPGRLALEPEAQPAQAPLGRVPAFQKVSPVIQRSLSATPVSVHMPGNDPDSPPMPEQDRPPGSQQAPSIQPAPIPKPAQLSILQPMLQQQSQAARRQATPAPEPVVNITIQHVEVIAATPSNSPKPTEESRPKGVMSLDEYLNKRQQEGKHEQ